MERFLALGAGINDGGVWKRRLGIAPAVEIITPEKGVLYS
jgi:hypothetical protein